MFHLLSNSFSKRIRQIDLFDIERAFRTLSCDSLSVLFYLPFFCDNDSENGRTKGIPDASTRYKAFVPYSDMICSKKSPLVIEGSYFLYSFP